MNCNHRPKIIADYVVWCDQCGAYKIEKAKIDWTLPINATDPLCPTPELQGTYPIVLYFQSEKEGLEFVEMVHKAKPNMVTIKMNRKPTQSKP